MGDHSTAASTVPNVLAKSTAVARDGNVASLAVVGDSATTVHGAQFGVNPTRDRRTRERYENWCDPFTKHCVLLLPIVHIAGRSRGG